MRGEMGKTAVAQTASARVRVQPRIGDEGEVARAYSHPDSVELSFCRAALWLTQRLRQGARSASNRPLPLRERPSRSV